MAPKCKLSEAVSPTFCGQPNNHGTIVPIEYQTFNEFEGGQSEIRSLLSKLRNDFNSYLNNLGDTFQDWRISLEEEHISTNGDHDYPPISTNPFLPLPHDLVSSADSDYFSDAGPVDCTIRNNASCLKDPRYESDTSVASPKAEIAATQRHIYNPALFPTQASIAFSETNSSTTNTEQCGNVTYVDEASAPFRTIDLPVSLDRRAIHKESSAISSKSISSGRSKVSPDIISQDSKILNQFLTYLEQEDKRNIARLDLLEAEQEDREAWRLAVKYRHEVGRLTFQDIKGRFYFPKKVV